MIDIAHRIYHLKGSARSVGLALGRMIGPRLDHLIGCYIQNGPGRYGLVDLDKLRHGALPWLRSLPERFQEELEGLAEGAGLPLQRIAEWSFVEVWYTFGGYPAASAGAWQRVEWPWPSLFDQSCRFVVISEPVAKVKGQDSGT